jgi:hypothetical protein
MVPLNFLQVRARSGIGKNDLPRRPGPQGPAKQLEAQRGFRQGHPRRGDLKPAGLQMLEEGQTPQAERETGQVHEAQDGQRGRTLVIAQAEMLFQVADGQLDRESRPVGSVSKVEMATPIDLIYKVLFPSISTFETPPPRAQSASISDQVAGRMLEA